MNRDVGAHPNDEHDQLDRGDWLPDYLHGGSSLYRNWDFRPSLDRDEGCQQIWWRAQFLNLFGATAFQDSHPEIFGFASGSGIVPLSGVGFLSRFFRRPLERAATLSSHTRDRWSEPRLAVRTHGLFLVQPFPSLLPWPSSPPAWRCYGF